MTVSAPTGKSPAPTTREKVAWCFFDFANSSYTTVILTVVYARYFVGVVVPGVTWHGVHEDTWLAAQGILANGLVVVSAPLVGAMADRRARKKRYLLVSTLVCVLGTALLGLFGAGQVLPALLVLAMATVAFGTGENLIAGFLPELTGPEGMGRLSAYGWSLGYLGGLVALWLSLVLVQHDAITAVPAATAAFFALAAAPTFLFLRERATPTADGQPILAAAFGQLRRTLRERSQWRDFFLFLLSILFFQGGIAVVIQFAAVFAAEEIGMEDSAIIGLFISLQLAAAGGAFAFGWIQDRVGSFVALSLSILIWLVAVILAYGATSSGDMMVAGILAGSAMGASQSASRALVGMFCPSGREGEWFGLWGLATKAAAILGLGFYGTVIAASSDRRLAILATVALFAVGLALLFFVNPGRGAAAARAGTDLPH